MMASSALPDLTENSQPPQPSGRRKPTRRETILDLVEILLQNEEGGQGPEKSAVHEDDKDESKLEEILGAEQFYKFRKRVNNLDKELRSFANATRQLGSSAAILSSAFDLRRRLAYLLYLYHENAADIFPKKIKPVPPVVEPTNKRRHKAIIRKHKGKNTMFTRPTIIEQVDLEDFPKQFELLAEDVATFAKCLNEFPEFSDEAVDASIYSFESDLKYWASCMAEYSGQFRYPAVQRYLHDLTVEIGEHLDTITMTLSMFIEVGVPTIRFAQKHGATNLLNLSTVATFFSAVTATTIQYSFEFTQNKIGNAVNAFWFASLVFSIASAVNSLLGLTWKQAMYRSPGHRVPWWVLIWIKRSPLVFLVMSVAFFSVGLCCFAYASGQHHITSIFTTVLTAFTSFGLVAVSLWFMSERWTYLRHSGKKWLSDVLADWIYMLFTLPGMSSVKAATRAVFRRLRRARRRLQRLSSKATKALSITSSEDEKDLDLEANNSVLPLTMNDLVTGSGRMSDATAVGGPLGTASIPGSPILPSSSPVADSIRPSSPPGTGSILEPPIETPGKVLWRNAIRTVRMRSAVSSNLAVLAQKSASTRGTPHRQRTTSSSMMANGANAADGPGSAVSKFRNRIKNLKPKLKDLASTQEIPAHNALVRHLQFSPDGKFLATSSWDRTSVILRVGDPFESHRILAHTKGRVGQVAWSPTGKHVLTKLIKGITVWTQDGVYKKTIVRPTDIEAIQWFPNGNAILSVEGSDVFKMDLAGNILDVYSFGKIKLHDVAVTPDCVRLLGVGPLLESPTGLRPSKCRAEKRLIVFNMETQQIENQTPVVNDVRDVTLSKTSDNKHLVALVSYENKAPPQLWNIELIKDRENISQTTARLTLRKTYQPRAPVDFAGPSYFGGKNDELILCAGKSGDIHIWDRESGELLHYIGSQASGGDLTCIAWNPASDNPFMFATGSHDGVVRIWTRHSDGAFDPTLPRTESPITQQDFESVLSTRESSPQPLGRERAVMFVDESGGGAGMPKNENGPPTS